MTQIFLVRHGTTGIPVNDQKPEDPLSDTGKKQAHFVAMHIKKHAPENIVHQIYTSQFKRAHQTAEAIAQVCNASVVADERLNEISASFDPMQLRELMRDKSVYEREMEWLKLSQEKVVLFLRELAKKHDGEIIVMVTHGNIIRGIIAEALLAPVDTVARMSLDNTGISLLEYENEFDYFRLRLFNDVSHLENNGL